MTQVLSMGIGLAAGALIGYLYFRGLWWTVRRMTETQNRDRTPYGLALFSFAVRSAMALAGFYLLLSLLGWEAMALALAGFIAVRIVAVRRWALQRPSVTGMPGGDEWN